MSSSPEDIRFQATRQLGLILDLQDSEAWRNFYQPRLAELLKSQRARLEDESLTPDELKNEQMRLSGMKRVAAMIEESERANRNIIGPQSVGPPLSGR